MLRPMGRKRFADMNCGIAQALEAFGDWWTLLIVRDAFFGAKRFGAGTPDVCGAVGTIFSILRKDRRSVTPQASLLQSGSEQVAAGCSLASLIGEVEARLAFDAEAREVVRRSVAATLGSALTVSLELCFDPELAQAG